MTPTLIITIAVAVVAAGIGGALVLRVRADRRAAIERGDDTALVRVGRARDANGQAVKLIDPLLLHALGRHDVIEPAALDRIVEELEPGYGGRRKLLLVFGFVGVGVLVLGGLSLAIEGTAAWPDVVSTLTNPAIIACVLGGFVGPIIAARAERLRRVRRVMLRHRCCPHCGYGLAGVPVRNGNGATVCPECACAWRLDEVGDDMESASARLAREQERKARERAAKIAVVAGLVALVAGVVAFLIMR